VRVESRRGSDPAAAFLFYVSGYRVRTYDKLPPAYFVLSLVATTVYVKESQYWSWTMGMVDDTMDVRCWYVRV